MKAKPFSPHLMRTFLAIAGFTLSLGIALAASIRFPLFPKASPSLGDALIRVEKQRQESFVRDPGILVGAEWSTAASFKVRMTNDMDHKWFSAPQEWAWFLTWIPRPIPGQENLDPRSKAFRVRSDGTVDRSVELGSFSAGMHLASPANFSDVPLPPMSALDAVAKVEAMLQKYPSQEEVLLLGVDWCTPARFQPRIRDGSYHWTSEKEEWAWILTWVRRTPPNDVLSLNMTLCG